MLSARKYDYYESYENYDYEEKLNIQEPSRVTRKTPKYGLAAFKAFLSIVMVLFVMISVIQRYAVISEMKYDIFDSKTQIKELNLKKEELQATLDSLFVIENVESIAKEQLNMQYPTPSQVVYIRCESNYSVIEDTFSTNLEIKKKEFSYLDSFKLIPAKISKVLN